MSDEKQLIGAPSNKPKFSLNMGKIPGVTPQATSGPNLTGGLTLGTELNTPSNNLMNKASYKNIAQLADQVSEMSQSPLHTGKVSNRFRARIGAGGIPTPLGSDMSRAKFDFSGYDPNQHKKKKAKSPTRKVTVRVEDDMEIFTTDFMDP